MRRSVTAATAAPLRARVFGAGPTGALAALALARSGWQVVLCDPQPAAALLDRSRAYALTHSSAELLEGLGLWQPLQAHLAPFRRLELCDQALQQQVSFGAADLPVHPGRSPADAVGWILQHRPLMALLLQALEGESGVSLRLADPAGCSSELPVDLEVAADGHHSPRRRAARIRHWHRPYRQGCLTVQVRLRGSEADQAWELFRPEGPFAVLPLGGDAFQLVWSAPLPRLQQLERLEPVAFLDALSAALPERLQAEVLLDQPRAFPVALEWAWPLQRRGLVVVGEAAHRSHPVGGQGLNLCWRDVAVLQQLAGQVQAGRLPSRQLPGRYAARRWLDIALVLFATDALVRLFSNRQPLLLPLRRLGLALLARAPWLRALSLSAMSDGPCRLRWP
ncbi:FAD-dependent monooxygenase [Synechococcus sp. HK05]|uniref:FAD-dependent monooxygenase n=1 Tax=Synechococcus sp. HK05 TaxID=2725975 RepID=UPI001C381C1E|nr:FAD-dependent monooxygenase [Synechococcus sp. HK05]MBV2351118.1 FAD-dependent monooxygenase [Synechococcus sp. HK05]